MIREYRKKILPDGKEIQHRDVITHTTTTKFGLKDRLRILFGQPVINLSQIYSDHEDAKILGSEAKAFVPRLFKKKIKKLSPQQLQEAYTKIKKSE